VTDITKCKKCNGDMQEGHALQQNYSGKPDFIGSKEVCTMSPDGTASLIKCLKCVDCGYSITMGAESKSVLKRIKVQQQAGL
jgi:hypothetical protein